MESEGEQEPLAWTKVAFPEKTLDLLCKGKTPLLALAGQILVLVVKMKVSSDDKNTRNYNTALDHVLELSLEAMEGRFNTSNSGSSSRMVTVCHLPPPPSSASSSSLTPIHLMCSPCISF